MFTPPKALRPIVSGLLNTWIPGSGMAASALWGAGDAAGRARSMKRRAQQSYPLRPATMWPPPPQLGQPYNPIYQRGLQSDVPVTRLPEVVVRGERLPPVGGGPPPVNLPRRPPVHPRNTVVSPTIKTDIATNVTTSDTNTFNPTINFNPVIRLGNTWDIQGGQMSQPVGGGYGIWR